MNAPELIADFTEDIQDNRPCDRPGCAVAVKPGDGHLIRSHKPGQPDRFVCSACHAYYMNKPTTIRAGGHAARKTVLPDPRDIRASVAAAQSRASINPPPVVAINNVQSRTGPDVHVPSAWTNSSSSHPVMALTQGQRKPTPGTTTYGYGVQHMQYGAQRARWANAASRGVIAETISLEIVAVHEGGGKKRHPRNCTVGSICEGLRDIDAQSTAQDLVTLALNTAIPQIKAYDPLFAWRSEEFVVRDKKWVNLTNYNAARPYFYDDCLHPSKSSKNGPRTMVFKTEQFSLFVVVPEKQWEEYEDFKEKREREKRASQALPEPARPARARRATRAHPSVAALTEASKAVPVTATSSNPIKTSAHFLPHDSATSADLVHPPDGVASSSNLPTTVMPTRLFHNASAITMSVKRQHHERSHSASSTTSCHSPPPKKPSNGALALPGRTVLREALRAGGTKDFNVKQAMQQKAEFVYFHPIPTLDLPVVIKNPSFDPDSVESSWGNLRLNLTTEAILGVGAFKTAQIGTITLTPLRPSGVGSQSNHAIAIKRSYINHNNDEEPGPPFIRPSLGEEMKRLYREANVLYWAKSLLSMTYEFVDVAIERAKESPPFEIPRLRFVDAGLIFVYSDRPKTSSKPVVGKWKTGSLTSIYLAEELIPKTNGKDNFVKFIHNGTAAPRKHLDPAMNELAQFLSFTQHVQYSEMKGQAYISDYQGFPPLLTDPQILTHPEIGGDSEVPLFGDGNLEIGVELFEQQHTCNKFCLWPPFGLKKL